MLIGAVGRPASDRTTLAGAPAMDGGTRWLGTQEATVALRPWGAETLDAEECWAEIAETGSWLALSGHLYRNVETDANIERGGAASLLLEHLSAKGPDAITTFDGSFAVAWFDGRTRRLHLLRDAFGNEPLFYSEVAGGVIFASRVRDLLATGLTPGGLCPQGLAQYLTYCYVPGEATLDRGVRQVPSASRLVIDPKRGITERHRFYRVSFAGPHLWDEREIADRYCSLLERAVLRRLGESRFGAFVSGGMDSSSMVTFARRHYDGPIRTFSYRCAGKSFDESVYARALAEAMHTEHTEIEYGEKETIQIDSVVAGMDVPMSDIGLEIGSWLLGAAADKQVDLILTGDGGDEMWASHPVYAAQRLLNRYERLPIPKFVDQSFRRFAAALPDSDQKRDLRVKIKRILPPLGLPAALEHYRWRVYYAPGELESVLMPEMAAKVRSYDPFQCVLDGNKGYDGPDDGLSPYIYNDYTTITPYYFHRLRLLRRFGIEVRFPYYDRALVEFCARIPARLKLEGIERTKRLFRAAMEGILPDAINHRKDKLGHSIPFKNWLREDGSLAPRIADVCSPESMRKRGLFRPEAVAQMTEEHRARRHNHSHQIWAIHVLELWLRAREGRI